MDAKQSLRLGLKLWIESDDGAVLSPGRLSLLEGIRRLGSLNKAAAEQRMSYRKAWGRIRDTEERLGQPLVRDGGGRKGYKLTELGDRLVDEYVAWREEVKAFAIERAGERFPWAVGNDLP